MNPRRHWSLPALDGERNGRWAGGKSKHPLYRTYQGMLARCHTPTATSFRYYGGRGITICQRWQDDFWNFVEDMGPRPEGHSIERIDNDGNYEPGNCKWLRRPNRSRIGAPVVPRPNPHDQGVRL